MVCYQEAREQADVKKWEYCKLLREDYYECLHHVKERAYHKQIKDKYFELKQKGLTKDWPQEIIPDYRYFKD